jgi:hypothetical protein
MFNKLFETLQQIFTKNKVLAAVFAIVMTATIAFAVTAPVLVKFSRDYSKELARYKIETEERIADLESNLTFQAVFDIRNIPGKEIYMFQQKVAEKTGSMFVPMWGYIFPYGANKRFPLRIEDDNNYTWVYDVANRPLITFENMRFEYNIVGEIFEEPEPEWAEMGEKYNYVIPGMVGRILTSHWAVVLDYVPDDKEKTYLDLQINSLKTEWESLLIQYNPGVKNLNYVFND